MVLTIPALLVVVLATPGLIGRPQELGSIPLLVIGLSQDEREIVIDVSGAIQAYMYEAMKLDVLSEPEPVVNLSIAENDTYDIHARIPANGSLTYSVHTWLLDRQDNYFEYNLTMAMTRDANDNPVMIFGLIDEDSPRTVRVVPPDDFRWAVPRRGEV